MNLQTKKYKSDLYKFPELCNSHYNMVKVCSVEWCRGSQDHCGPGVKFHGFPKDPDQAAKWTAFVSGGSGWKPHKMAFLCNAHFRPEMYSSAGRLKAKAFPGSVCS